MDKSADAFRTISEVAEALKLPQHVLRFWETRFPQIRPLKRGGNRRFYRPDDVALLGAIKTMLYVDGFTIRGVQRILKERGPRALAQRGSDGPGDDTHRPHLPIESGSAAFVEPFDDAEDTLAPGDDEGLAADGLPNGADLLDRLHAVLFELSECRRILTAVRE